MLLHGIVMQNIQSKTRSCFNSVISFITIILPLIASIIISPECFSTPPSFTPLPISAYGDLPDTSRVSLSPDGKNLAMLKNSSGTLVLVIYNFETGETKYLLKADNISVILNWYTWANNDVILISTGYTSKQRDIKYTQTRLSRYDLSSDEGLTYLVKPNKGRREKNAQFQDNIISFLPDKPDKILVSIGYDVVNSPSVYEVDVRTQKRSRVRKNKSYVEDWFADQQGNIRIGYHRNETKIYYRLYDQAGRKIRDLWSYEIFEKNVVHILGFDLDPNILYINALHNGRYAVFKVNLTDEKLTKELVLADDKYDVDGSLIYSPKTSAVIGIRHGSSDDNRTYWDEDYISLKKGLNKVIPNAKNTIISMSKDLTKYVLFSSSKEDPGSYFIGDRKKQKLSYLATTYPKINDTNYAGKQLVHYKARDGLSIEAYLTKPIREKEEVKSPAIILPHGGPMARDYEGFDYWAELFSNRGYIVFQPNFRGSSGYGYDFEMASIEGWGQAMQDDLQDAAKWLKRQNIVNENKICIAGASYGGYAALMAAVKHGESFKCAASFAGVSDIELIVSKARRFTNNEVVKKQFGTDSDKLEAASPVNFSEKINIPILLIHGTDDKVVPVAHSRDMAEELDDYDKDVRYVEIEGANHHLSVQAHRLQTLKEMVNFFDKHLK